jgi:hypothetical protein
MRINKLLALAAAAMVIVACNGISPNSPNDATIASENATALADAQALNGPDHNSLCRDITEVKLVLLPSPSDQDRSLTVQAIYLARLAASRCGVAPEWSSRPRGRLLATGRDSFIVKITRTVPSTVVLVTAKAPNGVKGTIRVE